MAVVKICGLKTVDAVEAAVDAGADLVGFVFFKKTPRYVTPPVASGLAGHVPADVIKTGLTVDATDDELAVIVASGAVDLLQLHGTETPERVAEVRRKFALPVMKALPIARPEDVEAARAFEAVADRLLFDAKPPAGAERPGGNALAFDWGLLAGTRWNVPWLLAGGLTPENVQAAVRLSGAPGVDVSSGVESAPGVKDIGLIRAFVQAAKAG
ncbi:MAG: phosphoribosylanthranilate isomerase [Rhodospirillales bacterium CG15_BIG_FIL_POST_REV_8_21_14_020_66_15]|nr:MAG: phosphoribosylanthranilate isomerase [Rhodospirillales bacterium CG15_BIG_FIL_POST_REV_8_21_14_020_66_15]